MDASVQCISLVFLCVVIHASTDISNTTYSVTLPDGTKIVCNKCKPGQRWTADCTQNNGTQCEECPKGHYESGYGRAEHCKRCDNCKGLRKRVVKKCTNKTNTQCGCEAGYYIKKEGQDNMLCYAHNQCPKGQKVKTQGTGLNDTVCEQCAPGNFSPNESFAEDCQPCSTCPAGYEPVETCPPDADTNCQPIQTGNGRLSDGVIAAIVIAILVFIVLVICCIAVLLARRDKGPQFVRKFYKKCISSRRSGPATNGRVPIRYRPTGELEDQEVIDSRLAQIFPDLSKDLIHPEWKFFFRYLFGENSDQYINEVELNNHGNVREQIHRLLKDWVMREREKATEERLMDALKQHNRMNLVQKYFGRESPSPVTNV